MHTVEHNAFFGYREFVVRVVRASAIYLLLSCLKYLGIPNVYSLFLVM